MYDPTLGRWTGTDPEQYIDGMNLYQALDSNPTSNVDPTGDAHIHLGGEKWDLPVVADFHHTHTVTPAEAKACGLPAGTVDLGYHLHGPNGQKYFPASGVVRDKNGKLTRAPNSFNKEWNKKVHDPKVQKKLASLGIMGILLLIGFTYNECSGENQKMVDEIYHAVWIMSLPGRSNADKALAADLVGYNVQKLFGSDIVGDLTTIQLLDSIGNLNAVQPEPGKDLVLDD